MRSRLRSVRPSPYLWAVLALTAAVRMPFWLESTHAYGHGDAIIWQVWARAIHEHGFLNVLRTTDTNNIGYHYVLWPTGAIYALISPDFELWTAPIRILIKVPPFVCDLALTVVVFLLASGRWAVDGRSAVSSPDVLDGTRDLRAAGAALAFGLAPGVVYDSMWWSQIDSVVTLTSLGALLLAWRGNPAAGWALWTIGFLLKPHPIVLLPVLGAVTLWRHGPTATARGAASACAVTIAALAPFLLHGDGARVVDVYERLFEQGPIDLVQGAWNGWSILDARGNPLPGDALFAISGLDVTYARLSLALAASAMVIVLAYLRSHFSLDGALLASAAIVITFYMVPTSTHERYLYAAFAFAAPLLVRWPRLIPAYALLSATWMLNLLAINPPDGRDVWQWHGTDFAIGVAALHIAAYLALMVWMATQALPDRMRLLRRGRPAAEQPATAA